MPALFKDGRTLASIVERARPGSAIPYHIGFLACDAQDDKTALDVGLMARRLSNGSVHLEVNRSREYGMGVGTLVQRKLSAGMWEYIFIKSTLAV